MIYRMNGNLLLSEVPYVLTICILENTYDLVEQGGLNKKEMQLNLCNTFSILIFIELNLFT